jgi:hypothetical protein
MKLYGSKQNLLPELFQTVRKRAVNTDKQPEKRKTKGEIIENINAIGTVPLEEKPGSYKTKRYTGVN